VRLSPTTTPKDDEQYEDRHCNYEVEHHACRSHRGEDLIWHTRMQREEYNLNQRARRLDVHEAHLRRRERICDHREVEICLARMSGTNTGRGNGPEQK
jgi:hypothetical protein